MYIVEREIGCWMAVPATDTWGSKSLQLPFSPAYSIQGGSDKSGIFFFFLLNGTTQLKIIRFC
jgi:hypothetical protein